MSAAVLKMQSMRTQKETSQVDSSIASESAIYGLEDYWVSYPQTNSSYTSSEHTGLPLDSTRQFEDLFASQQDFSQSGPNHHDAYGRLTPDSLFTDLDMQSDMDRCPPSILRETRSTSATMTASNAQQDTYNTVTTSPLNTLFNVEQISPLSDTKSSISSQRFTFTPSDYSLFTNDADSSSSKHRCDSLHSNTKSHFLQAKAGRRRGSIYVEPGSTRAAYLEKNRKAARKCRSKQKQQQDELVETARDVKRRNKILKAETEILKSGMRDLMEVVSKHTECPDARLKLYLQRKADRLVCQSEQDTLLTPCSGRSSSSPAYRDNTSSTDKD
jgi:cyclic AMP-dependent transcription factor ATF-2